MKAWEVHASIARGSWNDDIIGGFKLAYFQREADARAWAEQVKRQSFADGHGFTFAYDRITIEYRDVPKNWEAEIDAELPHPVRIQRARTRRLLRRVKS